MPVYFVDSSALVKRYRHEAGSERVNQLLDPAERLIMARLTQVEVSAAIVRRGRVTGVSTHDLAAVLATFDRDLRDSFDVVELDAPVIERATALAPRHGLRAADAVQLACALLARADAPQQEFTLVGNDLELNAAAVAEGLSVLDPTQV